VEISRGDLAALRRMASVQAHELLLIFYQLMALDRCRLGRSHRAGPASSGLGPEAIGDTIWTCAVPAADEQSALRPLPPLCDEQPCAAQAGCREPPDLLGLTEAHRWQGTSHAQVYI